MGQEQVESTIRTVNPTVSKPAFRLWARRGISAVLVLGAIPAMLLIAWMGVEIGLAVRSVNQARLAADAAALAAAARYADGFETANDDALAAAQACRGPNGPVSISVQDAPGGGGDVVFGQWDDEARIFTPDLDGGPAARVTVRFAADSPNGAPGLILWRIFQSGQVSFTRSSVAVYSPPKHTTSMLLQGSGSAVLEADDSATVSARGGVSIASADMGAVFVHGASRPGKVLAVPVLRVAGGVDASSRAAAGGSIEEGASIPADPMSMVDLPSIDAGAAGDVTSDTVGTTRVSPGAHERLVATAGTVVLEAGLHQFTQGISLSGSAQVQLEDAAIELAPTATVSLSGSAVVSGTPIATGDWSGFSVLQRGQTTTWTVGGSAVMDLTGDLYAPNAALSASGTALLRAQTGVLGSLRAADDASVRFDDRIESLDLPTVPGRARLVR